MKRGEEKKKRKKKKRKKKKEKRILGMDVWICMDCMDMYGFLDFCMDISLFHF